MLLRQETTRVTLAKEGPCSATHMNTSGAFQIFLLLLALVSTSGKPRDDQTCMGSSHSRPSKEHKMAVQSYVDKAIRENKVVSQKKANTLMLTSFRSLHILLSVTTHLVSVEEGLLLLHGC